MSRKEILNILFWILLGILVILILWRIFGNSPTDFSIILTAIFVMIFKMWAINDNINEFKSDVKTSFHKIKNDIKNLGSDVDYLKLKVNNFKNKSIK